MIFRILETDHGHEGDPADRQGERQVRQMQRRTSKAQDKLSKWPLQRGTEAVSRTFPNYNYQNKPTASFKKGNDDAGFVGAGEKCGGGGNALQRAKMFSGNRNLVSRVCGPVLLHP